MGVTITIMSGAEDGKVFQMDKKTLMLGRHPEDDIYIPYDTRVSRHHARITKENASYFIEDTGAEGKGSTNGTYINDSDKKIVEKTPVSSGDMVLLGGVWIKFEAKL